MESLLIAVDAAPFADRVASWLPDLAGAGVRRVTLFHAIEGVGSECVKELDDLRPRLDRLAVQLSAREVEADISLKRGDRVRWLASLAELRTNQVLVVGSRCTVAPVGGPVGSTLRRLLELSRVPLLVISTAREPSGHRLFDRPFLLSGGPWAASIDSRARALIPTPLTSTALDAGPVDGAPPEATLVVTGPDTSADAFGSLLNRCSCPVLVFPAPSLSLQPEKGPSTAITPPSEVSGAVRKA